MTGISLRGLTWGSSEFIDKADRAKYIEQVYEERRRIDEVFNDTKTIEARVYLSMAITEGVDE